MNEGDCVRIKNGEFAGRTGYISRLEIESDEAIVSLDNSKLDVWEATDNLSVIECDENDIPL